MKNFRYTLEKYAGSKTRFKCPECQNKSNTFVRYIDSETGEYIDASVGKCNRENKCGYHLKPQQFFERNGKPFMPYGGYHGLLSSKRITNPLKPTYIPPWIYQESLLPAKNNFLEYLRKLVGKDAMMKLREAYRIGCSEHWKGATVFWQLDTKGLIRTGKIMLYDRIIGKRIKEPYSHITWAHTAHKLPEFNLNQCLFGEHLLVGNDKPVGIVESEKTAIICSHYLPEMIWLATGGKSNFKAELFNKLKEREVTFFPDLGAYAAWEEKIMNELSFIKKRSIDTTIENCATEQERADGLDLADFLIVNKGLFE
jgi:hypothetical protein